VGRESEKHCGGPDLTCRGGSNASVALLKSKGGTRAEMVVGDSGRKNLKGNRGFRGNRKSVSMNKRGYGRSGLKLRV